LGLDRERRGTDDAAGLGADLDDLPHARMPLVEAVHLVRAPIEYEELSGGRLLKPGRLPEASCKVSGNRVDRAEHFRIECPERRGQNDRDDEDDDSAHVKEL